jgi:hypothetical protein
MLFYEIQGQKKHGINYSASDDALNVAGEKSIKYDHRNVSD